MMEDYYGRLYGGKKITALHMRELIDEYELQVRWRFCWHPVVVVEAKLWEVEARTIAPLKWCRVDVSDDDVMPWVDVVLREAAEPFFTGLQTHYEKRIVEAERPKKRRKK